MTALRRVRPRKAWEPGSFAPSYASTSVSRTATSPWRSTAFSSRGACSRTGPDKSGEAGTVTVHDRGQLVELLTRAHRRGAAAPVAGGDRPLDREDGADRRRERRRDRRELVVGELVELDAELLAPADTGARDLVGPPAWHALA